MIFLTSASSAAALVFYLPGMCTHTDTEGKQRKARVRNILKSSGKKYLMNTLHVHIMMNSLESCRSQLLAICRRWNELAIWFVASLR